MRRRTFWLLLCLFLGVACFSGYQVLRTLGEYRAGETAYSCLLYTSDAAVRPG